LSDEWHPARVATQRKEKVIVKKRILILVLLLVSGVWLAGIAFVQTTTISNPKAASVGLSELSKKLKRGKTFNVEVQVDLAGVNAPDGHASTLGSYVIPISFDRNALEFISAGGGDSAAFAPTSTTNAQTANANGVVTLVGAQTTSDAMMGTIGVASLSFRVIAAQKGNTILSINSELDSPGLSLASTAAATMTNNP
jgi:hypothetical protein